MAPKQTVYLKITSSSDGLHTYMPTGITTGQALSEGPKGKPQEKVKRVMKSQGRVREGGPR